MNLSLKRLFHSFIDICVMYTWKMAYNLQLNYNNINEIIITKR